MTTRMTQQSTAPLRLLAACFALALCSCSALPTPSENLIAPGAKYVAMGSSYAAGPGVGEPAETPGSRCGRSADNYAHQLARKRMLDLDDVSCGGATTADVLGPSHGLPAQVDALTPDTALVTVTIGGNDVGFIAGLLIGTCRDDGGPQLRPAFVTKTCDGMKARHKADLAESAHAPPPAQSDPQAWKSMELGLENIAQEVRRRSPRARLIFVDYVTVVPPDGGCPQLPLTAEATSEARATATRLARITAEVAKRSGADIVHASALSQEHHLCAAEPWVTGFEPAPGSWRFSPYHPDIHAMTAIANALDQQLAR